MQRFFNAILTTTLLFVFVSTAAVRAEEPAKAEKPPTKTKKVEANDVTLSVPEAWKLTRIMDQHSFLHIDSGDDIRVGDMIAFDISHPCTTFDKWRYLPVLDSQYGVIDAVQTFF